MAGLVSSGVSSGSPESGPNAGQPELIMSASIAPCEWPWYGRSRRQTTDRGFSVPGNSLKSHEIIVLPESRLKVVGVQRIDGTDIQMAPVPPSFRPESDDTIS